MNPIRKLAGQTAIYGLSSIVGRLLNYLLVPLHTRAFSPEQFGIVTEMYSYVAFLLIVLTYGFETAFFRFAGEHAERHRVYRTSLISLVISSTIFVSFCWIFAQPIAEIIKYPNKSEYVIWFSLILATDAVTAIPFSKLRLENKALRFAVFRLINIGVNISLNIFFIWLCPYLMKNGAPETKSMVLKVFNPDIGVGYVFIANLIASIITFLLLIPDMLHARNKKTAVIGNSSLPSEASEGTFIWFDGILWKRMMRYSFPLLIGGLAGITNEMFSRVSLKYQLPEAISMHELGIFGACYKVAILMTIFIQTFRFAAEPFFFSHAKEQNAKQLYADVMNWFVISCSMIYLSVMLFMDIIKYFIGEAYHGGLSIVPILLFANLFLGIYYNLSIWFKLNDKTYLGAWMTIGGAILTIILNYIWIPSYGYYGASWATFVVYFIMMIFSFILGHKFYPVPYDLKKIILYPLFAFIISWAFPVLFENDNVIVLAGKILVISAFAGAVYLLEVRKKRVFSHP